MIVTARELITDAYYLSSVVARRFETVDGNDITDGLRLLNSLLSLQTGNLRFVPYFKRIEINLLQGVEEYFLEDVYAMELMTFNLQDVRRQIYGVDRFTYFATPRANTIQSIPYQFHLERETGGSRIYVWFKPDQDYVAQASVKKALTNVTLDTNFADTYDQFYVEFLRWSLAQYICFDNRIAFPDDYKNKLAEIEQALQFVSPPDLTQKKISMVGGGWEYNYAQANIGGGYTAP